MKLDIGLESKRKMQIVASCGGITGSSPKKGRHDESYQGDKVSDIGQAFV